MLNLKFTLPLLLLFMCSSLAAQTSKMKVKTNNGSSKFTKTDEEGVLKTIEFEDAFLSTYQESKDAISNSPMTENITSKKTNSIGEKNSKYKAVKSSTPIYRFDTCQNCSKYMYFAKVGEEYYKIIFVDNQPMMDTSAKIYKNKKGNLVAHENVWASKL